MTFPIFLHAGCHHGHDQGLGQQLLDALLHSLSDIAWSLPILFLAYLLMELLERSQRLNESILHRYSHRTGPIFGGLLGAVPQCGISGAAATLFSTGSITVGTMLAVFFATSDEMLPIMLSSLRDGGISLGRLAAIVGAKAGLGIVLGYLADATLGRWLRSHKDIHSFCQREHCACDEGEGSVLLSSLKHTLRIGVLLLAVNFALHLLFTFVEVEQLSASILNRPVIGELLLALFGLIPNCSVSVVLTESYLAGVIGLGGLFAGLLSNAGIGLLVLLRSNRNRRENLAIVGSMLLLSALVGSLIRLIVPLF